MADAPEKVRLVVNGEDMIVDAAPRMTVLVHQQGIRVDVPEYVEVNGRTTIDVMSKMSQRAWVHISTGELFQHLFKMAFPNEPGREVTIPATIDALNKMDFGVIHVSGMIVQCCEAIFAGNKKIFLRNPEDMLHPRTQQCIMGMFIEMQKLLGIEEEGGVAVAPAPEPEKPVEPEAKEEKPKKVRKPRSKKKKKDD